MKPDIEAIRQSPRAYVDLETIEELSDYAMGLEEKVEALEANLKQANRWREVVEDELVICNILNESHKEPKKAVQDLMIYERQLSEYFTKLECKDRLKRSLFNALGIVLALVAIFGFIWNQAEAADIYRCTAEGRIAFQEEPCRDGRRIDMNRDVNVIQAPPAQAPGISQSHFSGGSAGRPAMGYYITGTPYGQFRSTSPVDVQYSNRYLSINGIEWRFGNGFQSALPWRAVGRSR